MCKLYFLEIWVFLTPDKPFLKDFFFRRMMINHRCMEEFWNFFSKLFKVKLEFYCITTDIITDITTDIADIVTEQTEWLC